MAETVPRTDAGPMVLTLTLSSQPAFLGTAEALAARLGEHAGCPPQVSNRLGQAVRLVLELLVSRARAEATPPEVELTLAATERLVRAELRFARGEGPAEPSFDDLLAEAGAGLDKLVDRVEVAREDGRSCCRITQQVRAGH